MLVDIGPPVYVSRSRDLRKGEDEAIIVYVTQEALSRAPGTGEMRPGLPVVRNMTAEILILTRLPGDGSEAAERGDDLSRQVEIALNNGAPDMAPISSSQGFQEGDQAGCLTTLTYTIEHTDPMKSEA